MNWTFSNVKLKNGKEKNKQKNTNIISTQHLLGINKSFNISQIIFSYYNLNVTMKFKEENTLNVRKTKPVFTLSLSDKFEK